MGSGGSTIKYIDRSGTSNGVVTISASSYNAISAVWLDPSTAVDPSIKFYRRNGNWCVESAYNGTVRFYYYT